MAPLLIKPFLHRRTLTTAAQAATHLQETFHAQTLTLRETLHPHHLQKLSLTLNRPHLHPSSPNLLHQAPAAGTPLPPGYHLIYFAPAQPEPILGPDGTDRTFNAPAPFTRRMWAGGSMRWTKGVPLRVGEEVEERTRLVGAVAKRSSKGGEMVLVEVEKEFWGPKGLALVDRRSWVFRPPPETAVLARSEEGVAGFVAGAVGRYSKAEDVTVEGSDFPQRQTNWSPVALFRFSALTFNAHMIHYNESWTRNVEGHPAVVVHGPLNLIGMLDYWRDVHGQTDREDGDVAEISYRALSPLYAGEEYVVRTDAVKKSDEGKKMWEIGVVRGDKMCMKGTITGHV